MLAVSRQMIDDVVVKDVSVFENKMERKKRRVR